MQYYIIFVVLHVLNCIVLRVLPFCCYMYRLLMQHNHFPQQIEISFIFSQIFQVSSISVGWSEGIDFATFYGLRFRTTVPDQHFLYVNQKIFSLSNQGECQLPETIFELLISQDESWCKSHKRSSHNFMENKKLTLEPRIRCLVGPGFREISSRENAP